MVKLFGVNISGLINKHISPGLLDATLIKVVPGTRTATSYAGGTNPVSTSFAARGVVVFYSDIQIDGTLIRKGDRQILLVGDSIASSKVPVPGDQITIQGSTYVIVADGVTSDPALAQYTCHCRSV